MGAKANAMWYSIIQTAKLNKLRVREYLEYLLEAFALAEQPDCKAHLPWSPESQERVRTTELKQARTNHLYQDFTVCIW